MPRWYDDPDWWLRAGVVLVVVVALVVVLVPLPWCIDEVHRAGWRRK